MYKETLGIVGGFGAYATLNFYKRVLEVFASESERNYPHIIMDNNFTMPSRTRALLYDEYFDEIVCDIKDSIQRLMSQEAKKIVLVCGTAHYFLPSVYKELPGAADCVVDIIDALGERMQQEDKKEALVIAAEGALKKELYSKRLEAYGVDCESPSEEMYQEIRFFIEAVKRNELNTSVAERYKTFLENYSTSNIILGCTEFPVLTEYIRNKCDCQWIQEYTFWDPLELVLKKLKRELV